jgi:MobA/VirD2-like, nuclease domain
MTTASPIAKVSIGRSGCGAAHASYITRMSALDPEGRDRAKSDVEERFEQLSLLTHDQTEKGDSSVTETLRENLDHRSLDAGKEHGGGTQRDADPVWTRNAPDFLTGDTDGSGQELDQSTIQEKLSLKEKTENLRLYFGSLEDYERRKGGRTHYRIILSFDVPATNQQIRDLTNDFLEQAFPKAIAFGAIHRDTDHPHAHVYLNSRQTDGRRIQLKNNEFKTIDEKWSKIYTDFAGDESAHVEYLRKKEETKQWKIAAAEAYRKGEPIPPKPERDNDRRERLAEQRLAAQRSDARDRGKQIESLKQAEPVIRPASEKQTSRLLAKAEVAREQLAHLIRIDAPELEIKSAARFAHDFAAALDKTLATRKVMGREWPPQVVYTTEEWKQLREYRASTDIPVKENRAAARLQANCVLAGAEMKDAQARAEAFQVSRHLWKLGVEGWEKGMSLKDVEQAINAKTDQKHKVYNFLRPSKKEEIQGQIDYMREVKKDVLKQLVTKELSIARGIGAAEVRFQVAAKQVEQTRDARAVNGKGMPSATYNRDELQKMIAIAQRNKDAQILGYAYEQVRGELLRDPSPGQLSRVRGRELMARMNMIKEGERFIAAVKYRDFRQVPVKDKAGLDYTKSIREVEPRSALELIVRHFTDSGDQKRERQQIGESARQQIAMAEARSIKAAEYSAMRDRIAQDHYRAAGLSSDQVAPELNPKEIAELREFAERLPALSADRREFTEGARQAERVNQDRETAEAARSADETRSHDLVTRTHDRYATEATRDTRSDRDSYSRGR